MKSVASGYTLIEVLIVVALVAVLVGITANYKISDARLQLAELEFQKNYQKAKNILIHAHNLNIQEFPASGDLNTQQLQAATRGKAWEASANQILALTAGHAKNDFTIRFNPQSTHVKFLIDDDIRLNGYRVQRQKIAGDKDEVILIKALPNNQGRVLRFDNYLEEEE